MTPPDRPPRRHRPAGRAAGPARAVLAALGVAAVLALGLAVTGVVPVPALAGLAERPGGTPGAAPSPSAAEDPTPRPTPTPSPTPTPPPDVSFTVLAAGDVLLHEPVMASARTPDGYDFRPLLAPVEPWVAGADLALCHLEVPVHPAGATPSGYPLFGAPPQIAASLAAGGWDGCSTASNHSVDRGVAGVAATLEALDAAGLGHVGTARTPEEAAAPQLYDVVREGRTVRVAHLAATYGTNGVPVPADAPWTVTLLDTASIVAQASAARAAGADLVLASIHCCVEYVSEPTPEQTALAAELAASGVVDLVIGHHAHVPQTIARLPGGPRGEGMWVAYGLGNLVSNQDGDCCTPRTDSGLLLTATVRQPADGPASVVGVDWTAVTVDRFGGHRVLPASAAVAAGQGAGTLDAATLATRRARVVEVVGAEAPERTVAPTPTGPAPVVVMRPAPTP
ncbi:CapA family protein [Actinotalea solisilvae]|uniref:CapA family protein n=1 Tax=Actinotalea solisilvae TaxID=2072922 RepID=UPI0027DB86E9|nr:CapA family protein [Actinotalea solisilvae]